MDKLQLEALFRQHYSKMYAMARTILYDEQDSKDAVSDVFEHLLSAEDSHLPAAFEPYLLISVRNSCLKKIHQKEARQRREKLYQEDISLANNTLEADEKRLQTVLKFAHQQLSSQELTIFKMRFMGEMTYPEIAEELGISRVAVWKHLAHLTSLLKEFIKTAKI